MRLTVALLALVGLGLATSATATTPGRNGLIAFTRYRLQNDPLRSAIYVVRPDGTGVRQVSRSPTAVEDDQAHWSPDAAWIVFDRCTSQGPCSIWLVRPDGTDQHRLRVACHSKPPPGDVCTDDSNPSFAPDGKHVVYQHEWGNVRHRATGDTIEHSSIVVADLDGGHGRTLREFDDYRGGVAAPRLSPDGKRLAFEQWTSGPHESSGALFVMNVDGTALRRITPWSLHAASADWSPDGGRILFAGSAAAGELQPGSKVYTVRPDGSGLELLRGVGPYHYVLTGSYSPDRKTAVIATDQAATPNPAGNTFADVVLLPLDGGALRPVTRSPNLDGWPTWGAAR